MYISAPILVWLKQIANMRRNKCYANIVNFVRAENRINSGLPRVSMVLNVIIRQILINALQIRAAI